MIQRAIELTTNSIGISMILSILLFIGIYGFKKNKGTYFEHKIMTFIFLYYMISLLYVTVYREGLFINTTHTINVKPLEVLLTSYQNLMVYDPIHAYVFLLYNIAGNIVWFIPFGYMINYFMKETSFTKVFLYSFMLSFLIESIQYLCYVGVSDVDDLIFNTIGGVIGYATYRIIQRKEWRNVNKGTGEALLEDFSGREKES